MVTIKDFKKGDTAFILNNPVTLTPLKEAEIIEATVASVGRKYVTVTFGRWSEKKYENYWRDSDHLVEKSEIGGHSYLFSSLTEVGNFIEKQKLTNWLKKAVERANTETFTLEQLKAIKEILDTNNEREE